MKTITNGYDYEVQNIGNKNLTQAIHFAQYKTVAGNKRELESDGTTREEILEMLIAKYEYDDAVLPCYHNTMIITLLKSALNHQIERGVEREMQGIKDTLIQGQDHFAITK